MQSVVGIALLVVGVVLIIFGMQASASLGSRLSELFSGTPSDRTIWLLLVGVVAQGNRIILMVLPPLENCLCYASHNRTSLWRSIPHVCPR